MKLAERLLKMKKNSDFKNFNHKSNFFREAQYLLETFYEDLSMFHDHFFRDIKFEDLSLLVAPTKKNHSKSILLRDFAEQTLPKNGADVIIPDPENFPELRDFAANTLA